MLGDLADYVRFQRRFLLESSPEELLFNGSRQIVEPDASTGGLGKTIWKNCFFKITIDQSII